ncbi:MAG: lipid-A-disaccharide synthase [Candidatus Omnitrophica bacterium]|nr:lipid-A-disaccharide synthase [Candidatus Omnitrophota bacterium]
MTHKKILIVSGEPSGDLHASNLIADLKSLDPGLEFFGLGGKLSERAGAEILYDIADLAIVGIVDVVKNAFKIRSAHKRLIERMDAAKPDLAILVDYPGFNLHLAGQLHKRGIPIVYYISPQVWAWGARRIVLIRRCVKKIVVFFKFEEELYKKHGIDAAFVGHPLIDTVKPSHDKAWVFAKYGLSTGKKTIALLPGSRMSEVSSLLPAMVENCKIIDKKLGGAQFIASKHPSIPMELYKKVVNGSGLNIVLAEADTYDIIAASDLAIAASGTVTLETAILGTPYVLVYKSSLVNYIAYRIVRKTPYLGIANIVAGKAVIPEFLQFDMTPEKISGAAVDILTHEDKRSKMVSDLKGIRLALGSPGASKRAASVIAPIL